MAPLGIRAGNDDQQQQRSVHRGKGEAVEYLSLPRGERGVEV